jgi:hypothetical protein
VLSSMCSIASRCLVIQGDRLRTSLHVNSLLTVYLVAGICTGGELGSASAARAQRKAHITAGVPQHAAERINTTH